MFTRLFARIDQSISIVATVFLYVAAAILVALLGLSLADVLGRNALNSGVNGTIEASVVMLILLTVLAFPLHQARSSFLGMDVLRERISGRVKTLLEATLILLQMGFASLLGWQSMNYAAKAAAAGEHSDVLNIPQEVPYLVSGISLFLVALIALFQAVRLACKPAQTNGGQSTGMKRDTSEGEEL